MAIVPETQNLINEFAAPSHHTKAQLRTWTKGSAKVVRLQGQQIALLRGQLQEAIEVEPDDVIAGKMETLEQQVLAQDRILSNMAKESRNLRTSRNLLDEIIVELNALAESAGYTIP